MAACQAQHLCGVRPSGATLRNSFAPYRAFRKHRAPASSPSSTSPLDAPPPLPPPLERALERLAAAQRAEPSGNEAAHTTALEEIEAMARDAGLDQFFGGANEGEFLAFPLTGRTAARLGGKPSLGVMSFGQYRPLDLTAEALSAEELAACGLDLDMHASKSADQVYTASYTFRISGTQAVGVHRAIAPFSVEGRRLALTFAALRLEPVTWGGEPQRRAQLGAWLELLGPHNAGMDAATGVLEVQLPTSPPAHLEYLLMGHKYQLVVGQAGSKTLLQRVGA